MPDKIYLGISETAKITGLSTFYLRKRIREGSIPNLQSGNKYYINLQELLKQLEKECELKSTSNNTENSVCKAVVRLTPRRVE